MNSSKAILTRRIFLFLFFVMCFKLSAYAQNTMSPVTQPDTLSASPEPLWTEQSKADSLTKPHKENSNEQNLLHLSASDRLTIDTTYVANKTIYNFPENYVADDELNTWQTFHVDDMYIFLNIREIPDERRFSLVNLYIQNNSNSDRFFNFTSSGLVTAKGKHLPFLPFDKFIKKKKAVAFWKTFASSIVIFTASLIVDKIITDAILDSNDYYSPIAEIGADIASFSVQVASEAMTMAVAEKFRADYDKTVKKNLDYLDNYMLGQNTAISGHMFVKSSKRNPVKINIEISNKIYSFTWDKEKAVRSLQ